MLQKVFWNDEALPQRKTLAQVLYEIRHDDADDELLLDSVTREDVLFDIDCLLDATLDALETVFSKLERKMQILQQVMNRSSANLQVLNVQITPPFKRQGTVQVAAIFELSDLQTVTIFFHNPDADPKRLAPTDTLLSWKWLLNKKDVTIVVAPEKGQDLNVREVARRIMKLAEKNSAAFARANAKKDERAKKIAAMQTGNAEKVKQIEELERELEDVLKSNVVVNSELRNVKQVQEMAQKIATDRFAYSKNAPKDTEVLTEIYRESSKRQGGSSLVPDAVSSAAKLYIKRGISLCERMQEEAEKWIEKFHPELYKGYEHIPEEFDSAVRKLNSLKETYANQNTDEILQTMKEVYELYIKTFYSSIYERLLDLQDEPESELDRLRELRDKEKQATHAAASVLNKLNARTKKQWMDDHIQIVGAGAESVKKAIEEKLGIGEPTTEPPKASNAEQLANLINQAYENGKDVFNAFKRPDMDAPIDIVVGDASKGLKHIIAQREKDGTLSVINKEELFETLAKTLQSGELHTQAQREDYKRLEIKQGESSVILIKEPNSNAWILTAWTISKERLAELMKLPPGERRSAHFNSAPTHVSPTISRTNVGAGGSADKSNSNPADAGRQGVIEYLNSIINRTLPTLVENSTGDKLEELYNKYREDSELEPLIVKAIDEWGHAVYEYTNKQSV